MHIKRIQKELMEEIERLRRVEQYLVHESEKNVRSSNQGDRDKERESNRGDRDKERVGIRGDREKERLRCAKKGNYYRYYLGNRYLNKSQMNLVREEANREYREKLIRPIRTKIVKLEHLLKDLSGEWYEPENVYDKLHPARKQLVDPIVPPAEEYIKRWLNEPYEIWEIRDEEVSGALYSQNGERVRSKSELIIADTLARYGVPYKYEYPLKLKNGSGVVTKRPDFVALNKTTLEMVIIEHLGMLDQERYYRNNIEKIDIYEKNGYLIGKNLLLLHETSYNALDTGLVARYIEQFLL